MYKNDVNVPGLKKLVIVSDLHIGLENFRSDMWAMQLKDMKDSYWIGLGDIVEGRPPSHPFFDAVNTQCYMQDQYNRFFKDVKPYSKKCLGLLLGNHEAGHVRQFTLNPMQTFCDDNDIPYLGDMALLTLKNKGKKFKILAMHGAGGGAQIGSAINKLTNFSRTFNPDLAVCGHFHKPALAIDARGAEKARYNVINGALLDGYADGSAGSYAEQKMLMPGIPSYTVIYFTDSLAVDYVKFVV